MPAPSPPGLKSSIEDFAMSVGLAGLCRAIGSPRTSRLALREYRACHHLQKLSCCVKSSPRETSAQVDCEGPWSRNPTIRGWVVLHRWPGHRRRFHCAVDVRSSALSATRPRGRALLIRPRLMARTYASSRSRNTSMRWRETKNAFPNWPQSLVATIHFSVDRQFHLPPPHKRLPIREAPA